MADRKPYLGSRGSSGSRTPYLGGTSAKKSGGGGILGTIGRAVGQGASDLEHVAINAPAGIAHLAVGDYHALGTAVHHPFGPTGLHGLIHHPTDIFALTPAGKEQKASIKETIAHPLRHPGITALTALPFASGALRAAEIGAGVDVAAPRVLRVGGEEVHPEQSRSAIGRTFQRTTDTTLQRAAARTPGGRAETILQRRVGKVKTAEARQIERQYKGPSQALSKMSRKLKPGEQKALQVVAEQTPLRARITAASARVIGSKSEAARARHQDELKHLHAADPHLTVRNGKPALAEPRLQRVYDQMEKVAGGREQLLEHFGLLTPEGKLSRTTKAGRIALGSDSFTPTETAVRIPDVATRKGVKQLQRMGTVGAQGTIGHLRAPGSVTHEYTGVLREHGLRRQDTAQLVAESGLEAGKYAAMQHIHDFARAIAQPHPTRADDIAVRLDNLKGHEKMPPEVRKFLADPGEFFKSSTPGEQASALDQVRQRTFMQPHKLSGADRAEFDKLSAEGKIGWVPKRALGQIANPTAPLRAVTPGSTVGAVDAINNASRFAILYLKPAYAVPNMLGNTALSLIQQGFAAPRNLAQAARLVQRLHDDDYARIDASMGEGVARAIASHNTGRLAGTVDKAAGLWSKAVDTPFRRSSFIHEARKAGHTTPQQIHELLNRAPTDPELTRIGTKANRDLIDYENLSNTEREVVRRVIFFYPWVKGSTVYAGRFVREHPVQAAAVGQLGQQGEQYSQSRLGQTPSYLEGLIPFGSNRAINPASSAILGTPAQVGMAAQGLLSGNIPEAAMATQFASPAAALALGEITRRDTGGFPYKPGTGGPAIARDTLTGGLPQVALYKEIKAAITKKGGSKLYPPSVGGALGKFLLGGVYPRKIDRRRLNLLARQEQARMRTGR